MSRFTAALALAAFFVATPAFAGDSDDSMLAHVQDELRDVRNRLTDEWSHARQVRQQIETIQQSPRGATLEGKTRIEELRAKLDVCRYRIEDLRDERQMLVDERIALRARKADSPSAFAGATGIR